MSIEMERASHRRRRGTAEIELMLVIPILLAILFLTGAALKLGAARLANVSNAENHAYAQVVIGLDATNSAIAPIDGITAIRPGLPNRFDEADLSQVVATAVGQNRMPTITLRDQAMFLDPSWNYASWPARDDRPSYQAWFDNYAGEDHPSDLVTSLGLQPSWPPQ